MTNMSGIRVRKGLPPGEADMPTCGLCRRQIGRDEEYATVPNVEPSTLREVRHNDPECLRYTHGPASALVVGAQVHSIRYQVSEWGGAIPGVITERLDTFDAKGWRGYMIAPQNPEDTSPITRYRSHPDEFFRRLENDLVWDPEPRLVFISDKEWTHYVLPVA